MTGCDSRIAPTMVQISFQAHACASGSISILWTFNAVGHPDLNSECPELAVERFVRAILSRHSGVDALYRCLLASAGATRP